MPSPQSDCNLLFGIFALQMDFISRDALIKGMNAWVLEKTTPLGEILCQQGALRGDMRQFVEAMIEKHLEVHDNDPQKSLAAVSSLGSVRRDLESIADADLEKSLAQVSVTPRGDGAPSTISYAVGDSTSAGTRFRILRPHAKGGLGEVYVAQDQELNREVALKQIQERHADNPDGRSRFLREAEITGGLEHPGIVPVYGLGQYGDGRPFYAMRFIKGDSLKDAIERFHRKRSTDFADYTDEAKSVKSAKSAKSVDQFAGVEFHKLLRRFLDICNAIQYAHDRGVLHRDLKPGNIMLGKYGETLVVDWGLAKVRGEERGERGETEEKTLRPASASGSAETVAGSVLGTPQYMSPEQAEGRLDLLGPASDVYSLGATLYCVLTGKAPFQDAATGRILDKVQKADFSPPRAVKPDVPTPLEAVCLKAMARRPKDRYQSPRDMADDIEHWLADEPVSAWPEPWTVKTGRWMRRNKPLVSGAAAAIFVGLIALTGGLLWYQGEQNQRAQKKALAEEGARNALAQVEEIRTALHQTLGKPGGVFELLNHPENWEAQIKIAETALKSAKERLADAGQDVSPELDQKARAFEALLAQDNKDRRLAVRLEKIRMEKATWVEGKFDFRKAAEDYPKVFASADLAISNEDRADAVARIGASAIKDELVAALDDWAVVADVLDRKTLAERLLEAARQAAPDAHWGERLRRIEAWRDQLAVSELAKTAPTAGLSPQTLVLVGYLLRAQRPVQESWLRQAQPHYPTDFWLNFDLANALLKSNAAEAAGYYWAAIAIRPRSSPAYNNLGNALVDQKKLSEAINACRKAIELDPKCAFGYNSLGNALYYQKKLPEAIAAYRKAIELDPKRARAYNNLGNAFNEQKKLPEAILAFRKAVELDPNCAPAYYNLGRTHYYQKKLPEAIAALCKAIKLDPKYAAAYNNLGIALRDQKKLPEAILAFRKAVELDPKDTGAYYNLGTALYYHKKLPEAVAAFREAIGLSPDDAEAHCNLAHALRDCGDFAAALEAFQTGHRLGSRQSGWPYPSDRWVRDCQELLTLDQRIPVTLNGQAASAVELLVMANVCQRYKKRYRDAAALFGKAFATQGNLAEDLRNHSRYNAACVASLAAAGEGADASGLKTNDKINLRKQAHVWLQADLAARARPLEKRAGSAIAVLQIEHDLTHWQTDADLASVRNPKELAKLPNDEAKLWQKLWSDVATLLKEARSRFIDTRLEGELTEKDKSKVHSWKLTAGRTYVIEMTSTAFDTFLKLEDQDGKLLAENDDIVPGVNTNSRLIFTAPRDGVYHIIATSFEQAGRGAYVLLIREFTGRK